MLRNTLSYAALLLVLGCGDGGDGPGPVARRAYLAEIVGQFEQSYELSSVPDRAVRTLAEYRGDAVIGSMFMAALADRVSARVVGVREAGDSATVELSVTMPNVLRAAGDMIGAAFAGALSGDSAGVAEAMERRVREGLPDTTVTKTMRLVREDAGWRVVRGWPAELLRDRARAADRAGDKGLALARYDSALALNRHDSTAAEEASRLRVEVAALEARRAYIDGFLTLERVRVAEGRRYSFGDPEPGVFGQIRNRGDSTLTRVQVTVYFLDASGRRIAEHTYHPVLVSEFSINREGPLRPGYVREFGYVVARDAPSEWARRVEAEVTAIEFESERGR